MPSKVPSHRPTWMKPVTPRPRENTEWRQFINSPAWRGGGGGGAANHSWHHTPVLRLPDEEQTGGCYPDTPHTGR